LSLLANIEGDQLNTQHAQHRPKPWYKEEPLITQYSMRNITLNYSVRRGWSLYIHVCSSSAVAFAHIAMSTRGAEERGEEQREYEWAVFAGEAMTKEVRRADEEGYMQRLQSDEENHREYCSLLNTQNEHPWPKSMGKLYYCR
jgi:hypothetical protein